MGSIRRTGELAGKQGEDNARERKDEEFLRIREEKVKESCRRDSKGETKRTSEVAVAMDDF